MLATRNSQAGGAPLRILGVPDTFAPTGTAEFLLEHFGLTAKGIEAAALDLTRGTAEGMSFPWTTSEAILAIDQGTTNTKALCVERMVRRELSRQRRRSACCRPRGDGWSNLRKRSGDLCSRR